MIIKDVYDVREQFKRLLDEERFTSVSREATMTSLVGGSTIEIVNANFVADEDAIFGTVNQDYVRREEEWYMSCSLNVNDIPGGPPQVWKTVADKDGFINSNYGWCLFSSENGDQYENVLNELVMNRESRRAVAIYTRPSMWIDYNLRGRSDFMCTNTVQYLVRNGEVHAIVQMRSNDAVFGFKNDRAWQQHILEKLTRDLNVTIDKFGVYADQHYKPGKLYWNAGSLHVYSRHFHLIDPIKYPQEKK